MAEIEFVNVLEELSAKPSAVKDLSFASRTMDSLLLRASLIGQDHDTAAYPGLETPDQGEIRIGGKDVTCCRQPRAMSRWCPEPGALPAYDGARQYPIPTGGAQSGAGRDRDAPRRCPPRSFISVISCISCRLISRAASASASRSPAPSWSRPNAYLMDDPISALDARLREENPRRAQTHSDRAGPHACLCNSRPGRGDVGR